MKQATINRLHRSILTQIGTDPEFPPVRHGADHPPQEPDLVTPGFYQPWCGTASQRQSLAPALCWGMAQDNFSRRTTSEIARGKSVMFSAHFEDGRTGYFVIPRHGTSDEDLQGDGRRPEAAAHWRAAGRRDPHGEARSLRSPRPWRPTVGSDYIFGPRPIRSPLPPVHRDLTSSKVLRRPLCEWCR